MAQSYAAAVFGHLSVLFDPNTELASDMPACILTCSLCGARVPMQRLTIQHLPELGEARVIENHRMICRGGCDISFGDRWTLRKERKKLLDERLRRNVRRNRRGARRND